MGERFIESSKWLAIAGLCGWLAAAAAGSPPPGEETVLPGNSERGQRVFEEQRCVQCHAVNGKGGRIGPDLGKRVARSYTPALLAVTMWNHAPVMWNVMEAAKIEKPRMTAQNAADLFAFFYSSRFFDRPGDPKLGRQAFRANRCGDCHGITESRAESAPPVNLWESLGHPIVLVQQMWNHSGRMREAFARRGIPWQQLTSEELNNILAYLRSLPETRGVSSSFSNTSGGRGREIFHQKSCSKCHTGELALEKRLGGLTLTEIAVEMWNHAPKMIQPPPTLSREEMQELLSYLWMRQFIHPGGNAARGKQVFARRRCAQCHYGGVHGAPQLPGQNREYSEVTIMSALWRHGPQMLARMKKARVNWPVFADAQELGDLITYLNSVQ